MRSSTTIYSGISTLGRETFGQLNSGDTSGDHIRTKNVQTIYCNPSRCTRVSNYNELNALRNSFRAKYLSNKNTIQSQKNGLVSGLYTELDLNSVNVMSNSTTNVSPTSISLTSIPYLDYNIDPSGKLFGNNLCGLNNFINYKVSNNHSLNRILQL